ncbi:MAG: hypothetical protein IPL67_19580 [Ignavibacteria bacterium]|nr:hypothetical protein [Ignavibacteria bacterium]
MKTTILFCCILCLLIITTSFADSYSQVTWERQPNPSNRILSSCYFVNNSTGWIAGDSGLIMRTTDAGNNWTTQNSNTFINIERIFFLNQRIGYALAWNVFPDTNEFLGTMILKTTNGGDQWTNSMYPDTNRFLRDIIFLDSTTGFIGGSPILIAKTTNAGATWFTTDADTLNIGLPVFSIKFINSLTGYASGGFRDIAGAMWRTTNGGLRWFSQIVGPEPLTDLEIITPQKVVAVGGDFEYGSSYVKTLNGGLNWTYDTLGVFGVAQAVDFRTPLEGWISLGISQKYGYTLDGAQTWTNLYTPDSVIINDIQFTDSLHGWAVGYFGAFLKYDGTMVSVNENSSATLPGDFELRQNFPNPFNPVTKISYALNRDGNVRLELFDASGKSIRELVNGFLSEGEYDYSFHGEGLSSGIYFCTMSFEATGTFANNSGITSETIKLVLLK